MYRFVGAMTEGLFGSAKTDSAPCYDYCMQADSPILDDLARDLCRSPLLVITGAGISLASGIPTFRGADPGAVWSVDVTTLGTRDYFERDPVGSWRWYLGRFGGLFGKLPNPAHHALVAMEHLAKQSGRDFLLVTQNVDTLHEQAGSQELAKVHGNADRVRCSLLGCRYAAPMGSLPRADFDVTAFLANPIEANIPHCPACGSLLRQHVLWFDEYYTEHTDYQYRRVEKALRRCATILFVGTSFSVGLTQTALDVGCARIPVWSIDPSGAAPNAAVRVIKGKAEEVLPAVVARMNGITAD